MKQVPSSLEDLIAPLSEAEFLQHLQARKLKLLRGAHPDRFRPLLDWPALQAMIVRGEHPTSLVEFCLARDSVLVPPERWLARDPERNTNVVDLRKLIGFMNEGFSLVLQPMDGHVPQLASLCDSIRARVGEHVKAGVIVTHGRGGAFKLHYDPEDLLILQVEGTKRWRICGPPVTNPVAGMPMLPPPPEEAPIFDDVLRPGDVLFVPGGNWHRCIGGVGRSLHLTIFLTPPTGWHAVKALTSALLADELLAKPLTRLDETSDRPALEADLKERVIRRVQEFDFERFLADWPKRRH